MVTTVQEKQFQTAEARVLSGMKVRCVQEDLSRAATLVRHAIDFQSGLPILSNIVLETDKGRLKLYATNLKVGITCWIEAEVLSEGKTALPAKTFVDHVNNLLSGTVEISVTVRDDRHDVKVKSVGSHTEMVGVDTTLYPSVACYKGQEITAVLDAQVLREAVSHVGFAAAQDESRPILTAMRVVFGREEVSFTAADAFRVALRTVALPDSESGNVLGEILVPAASLIELARILPAEGRVHMILTPNKAEVLFHTESLDLTTRLLEGTYLKVEGVIHSEKDFVTTATIHAEDLAAAVRRVTPFTTRDGSSVVTLTLNSEEGEDGQVVLNAAAEAVGRNISTVDAVVEGPEMKVALNARYLSEFLAAINVTETVALKLISPTSPVTLSVVGLAGYVYVVMPKSTSGD